MTDQSPREKVAAEFHFQSGTCADIGSAIYGDLCLQIARSLEAEDGGPLWPVLESHAHLRFGLAVPLRFLGAVHRLALNGDAPNLSRHYPSCGGEPGPTLWQDFVDTVTLHATTVRSGLDAGVQTNEVVRSSALFEAFGVATSRSALPLALREIGCSGGLNLRLDKYRYVDGDREYLADEPDAARSTNNGSGGLTVDIVDRWQGKRPHLTPIIVASRAGCDPAPVDPTTPEGRLLLTGFLWPDQTDRIARTKAALDLAERFEARIDRAHADKWVAQELDSRESGLCTVFFHSIVWQYIDKDERARITETFERTGATATAERPVAWISFEPREPDRECVAVILRYWDGVSHAGEPELLATAGFHGQWVVLE
jgi:hypothetical protein